MRDRGHPYELSCCKCNAYKQLFLNTRPNACCTLDWSGHKDAQYKKKLYK